MVNGLEYGWGGGGEVHGVCRVGGVCGVRYLRWSMVNQVEYGWGGVSGVGTALGDYLSAPLHHWTINPQHTTQRFTKISKRTHKIRIHKTDIHLEKQEYVSDVRTPTIILQFCLQKFYY